MLAVSLLGLTGLDEVILKEVMVDHVAAEDLFEYSVDSIVYAALSCTSLDTRERCDGGKHCLCQALAHASLGASCEEHGTAEKANAGASEQVELICTPAAKDPFAAGGQDFCKSCHQDANLQ